MTTLATRVYLGPERLRIARVATGPTVAVGGLFGEVGVVGPLAGPHGLRVVRGHTFTVRDLAFGPSGRLLTGGGDGRTRTWGPDLTLERDDAAPAPIVAVAWLGDLPVAADAAGGVTIDGRRHPGHEGPATALAVADGIAWTTGIDGRVLGWTARGLEHRLPRRAAPIDSVWAGGGEVVTGDADGNVTIDGPRPRRIPCGAAVFRVAALDGGAVAATVDGKIHVEGHPPFATGTAGVFPVVFDGARVAVGSAGGVRVWSARTLAPVAVLAPRMRGSSLADLAFGSGRVWGVSHELVEWALTESADPVVAHVGWVRGVVPWGPASASYGSDGTVVVRSPSGVRQFAAHGGICWSAAVSPDGQLLATGGDGEVCLWDVGFVRVRRWATPGHAVAFLPDGTLLAGGRHVRLAAMDPAADGIRVLGTAGSGFSDQTQRIELDGDHVIARSTSGTAGVHFDLATGASDEVERPPVPPPGRDDDPPMPPEVAGVWGSDAPAPPLPDEAGPPWLRRWLEAAVQRTWSPRPALALALTRLGVPAHPAIVAWELASGTFRVGGTAVGHEVLVSARDRTSGSGRVRVRVAQDWPSWFAADADGAVWERRDGVDRRVGTLADLAPLLALRSSSGPAVAHLVVEDAAGDTIAAGLGAVLAHVAGPARWWLADGAQVAEDGETTVSASKAVALATALASVPGRRVRLDGVERATIRPLAEAPEAPPIPDGAWPLAWARVDVSGFVERAPGKKVELRQTVARGGRVVEQTSVGGRPSVTRWIGVSGAEPPAASIVVRAWLAANDGRRSPLDTADAGALTDALTLRGYAAHDAILEAEASLGGLSFADPHQRGQPPYALGAWQYLALWPRGWQFDEDARAAGLAPFASGPGDTVYAVGPDGRVYLQEMVAMGEPVPCAASAVSWLEQLVRSLATPGPRRR